MDPRQISAHLLKTAFVGSLEAQLSTIKDPAEQSTALCTIGQRLALHLETMPFSSEHGIDTRAHRQIILGQLNAAIDELLKRRPKDLAR